MSPQLRLPRPPLPDRHTGIIQTAPLLLQEIADNARHPGLWTHRAEEVLQLLYAAHIEPSTELPVYPAEWRPLMLRHRQHNIDGEWRPLKKQQSHRQVATVLRRRGLYEPRPEPQSVPQADAIVQWASRHWAFSRWTDEYRFRLTTWLAWPEALEPSPRPAHLTD